MCIFTFKPKNHHERQIELSLSSDENQQGSWRLRNLHEPGFLVLPWECEDRLNIDEAKCVSGHDQLYDIILSLPTYCVFDVPLGNNREDANQQASFCLDEGNVLIYNSVFYDASILTQRLHLALLSFSLQFLQKTVSSFSQPWPRPCLFKTHSMAPTLPFFKWSLLHFPLTRVRMSFVIVVSFNLINDITSSFPCQLPDLITKGTSHILEIEKPRHKVSHARFVGCLLILGLSCA